MGRGMERGRVGGLEEMKEEREKKKGKKKRENDRGRKGRLKSVCCCHYNCSLTSHEGLHGVTTSCYGNISRYQTSAEILSESINSLQSASSIHPVLRYRNHVHMSPLTLHVCTCAQIITMFASYSLV